jgi:cytoskeleton protein RodZ
LPAEVGRAESSEAIFAEIGRKLQARREMLSLTYEEIERHTKVRVAFQKALEQGAIESLPSPVQTRGILANYAAFLDLDTDDILLRFADGLQARHREQKPQWQPERTRSPMTVHTDLPPLRSFIASDLIFGGGVAVMLILFALWGIGRVMSVRQQTAVRAQATSPSISEVLAGTAVPTEIQQVTVIPADDTGLAPTFTPEGTIEAATLDPNVPIRVTLSAVRRTFVRVSVDGKVQFEGRLEPGKDYSYGGGSRVEVLVGDASGIKVSFNGRDLGLMGNFGEVVDLIYTAGGAFTPTATLEPTRTPAPVLTGTVSPVPSTTPPATATP